MEGGVFRDPGLEPGVKCQENQEDSDVSVGCLGKGQSYWLHKEAGAGMRLQHGSETEDRVSAWGWPRGEEVPWRVENQARSLRPSHMTSHQSRVWRGSPT